MTTKSHERTVPHLFFTLTQVAMKNNFADSLFASICKRSANDVVSTISKGSANRANEWSTEIISMQFYVAVLFHNFTLLSFSRRQHLRPAVHSGDQGDVDQTGPRAEAARKSGEAAMDPYRDKVQRHARRKYGVSELMTNAEKPDVKTEMLTVR